jgi:hypothetical protein
MWTFKADHRIRNDWSLSGLYVYNRTEEPGSSLMTRDKWYIADRREFFEPLRRRPHVVVANTTAVLNSTTTLSLRSGWTTWEDSYAKQPFEPGLQSLGFSPAFVSALGPGGADTFPSIDFDEVTSVGGWGGLPTRWGSSSVAGLLSKLAGTHGVKLGAEVRQLEVTTATQSRPSGAFQFNRLFTSKNGVGGHDLASFLLGLPASGFVPANLGEGNWTAMRLVA